VEPNDLQKPDLRRALVVPDICHQFRKILTGIHRYMMVNTTWHLCLACGAPSKSIIPVLRKAQTNVALISVRSKQLNSELLTMR
jgi:hypothetical protein